MNQISRILLAGIGFGLALAAALSTPDVAHARQGQRAYEAVPALDGVFQAFETHSIVAMSDRHGFAQQFDFYGAIVADPRFAREVGHVVVEFGTAKHQNVIDRYVNGGDVPYEDLRAVWADTAGYTPYPNSLGYPYFYAQVRAINASLPPGPRIKVWLGDPPIDWTEIHGPGDFRAILSTRDSHAAGVVIDNILSKGGKALVIYGGAHLDTPAPGRAQVQRESARPGAEAALRRVFSDAVAGRSLMRWSTPRFAGFMGPFESVAAAQLMDLGAPTAVRFVDGDRWGVDVFDLEFEDAPPTRASIRIDGAGQLMYFDLVGGYAALGAQIEASYPGALYVVPAYAGLSSADCTRRFEAVLGPIVGPVLLTGVASSRLAEVLDAPECGPFINEPDFAAISADDEEEAVRLAEWREQARRVQRPDQLLYLGSAATLTGAPIQPDWYLDVEFREEIIRRNGLKDVTPYGGVMDARDFRLAPWYFQPPPEIAEMARVADEAERLRLFRSNDQDGDGQLDKSEYLQILRVRGGAGQLDFLFSLRDSNRDGFVTAEEYAEQMQ